MTNRLRTILLIAGIPALLATAGCTSPSPAEFAATLFKGWCRNAPEHCTDRSEESRL